MTIASAAGGAARALDHVVRLAVEGIRAGPGRARRQRFTWLMEAADELAQSNTGGLSTLARGVARRLQAPLLVAALESPQHGAKVSADFDRLFFSDYGQITADGRSLNDLLGRYDAQRNKQQQQLVRLQLARDVVLPWAWHRGRLLDAVREIGSGRAKGAWRFDKVNHSVEVLLPFGLGIVHGGNHSMTVGILDGVGEVNAKVMDLSVAYPHVRYDGESFVRVHDGHVLNRPKREEPGILFEIGRRMLESAAPYELTPVR